MRMFYKKTWLCEPMFIPKMSSAYQEKSFGKLWEQGKDGMKVYFINKKSHGRALSHLKATMDVWFKKDAICRAEKDHLLRNK